MSIFEYIPLMKEMGGITGYAGAIIVALFLLIVICRMISGMRQGFWRQLVNSARCLTAAVLSFGIASMISGGILGAFDGMSFDDLVAKLDKFNFRITDQLSAAISCISPESFEYLLLLPAAVIIVPIVFLVLFIVLNNILRIASALIINLLGFKKAESAPSRLGGAILAGFDAVLVFMILVMPVSGALGIVDEAYGIIFEEQENRDSEDIVEQYETVFMPFIENPAINFVGKLGGNKISQSFSTVKLDGKSVNLKNDIMEIIHIALVEGPSLKGADFSSLTEKNKVAVSSILESVKSSPFLSNILVGFIRGAAGAINSGVIPINFGEYTEVLGGVVGYLSSIDATTLGEDAETVKALYFELSDSRVLSALKEGGNIMSLLEEKRKIGDDVFARIVEILKSNARTSAFMTSITKALISNISTTVTVNGVEVEVTYENVKESFSDVIAVNKNNFSTDKEYKDELSSVLDKALSENGIELEDEIVEGIADYVGDNYSDLNGKLTDEQFNDILLEYYEVYLNYINNGLVP